MPVNPGAPAPAPQPQTPVAGGGIIYASGSTIVPVSGVSGVGPASGFYEGPWLITTQTMRVDYHRVPLMNVSSMSLSLSSGSITHNIWQTRLASIIDATVTITSADTGYPLSGTVQQGQKFEWFPVSADALGTSYGDITTSTLGPLGTIETVMPYYKRELLDPATISPNDLGTSSIHCSNYHSFSSGTGQNHTENQEYSNAQSFDAFARGTNRAGTFLWDTATQSIFAGTGTDYSLNGAYQTIQENRYMIYVLLDTIGTTLANKRFEAIPSQRTPGVTWGEYENLVGLGNYDKNRHDYS